MREKLVQFFKQRLKNDGTFRSETSALLTDAHILTPEELADFDSTLREKSLPPLEPGAAGVVFAPQDPFTGFFVIVFFAIAFLIALPNISSLWRSTTAGLSFAVILKAFAVPVFAAVFVVFLARMGMYRRVWVLVETERLRIRTRAFGIVGNRIIPFRGIAGIRYGQEEEGRRGWNGVSLLLDSGERAHLLLLECAGSTLANNNAGFLVRALSFATGAAVSGTITEDGLGPVAGAGIDLRNPPQEGTRTLSEPLAEALRRAPPPGIAVLTPASAKWRWTQFFFQYGGQVPLFAVRREGRNLLLSFAGYCAALFFAVWTWTLRHAYLTWIEAGMYDLPALIAAAKLVALPYISLAGLRIGFRFLFGSQWLVFLEDRLDVHRRGLIFHTTLAKISRAEVAFISIDRNGLSAKLVVERKRKRHYRLPWPLREEEAEWIGALASQWFGLSEKGNL